MINHARLIAALRDTAAKATETKTIKVSRMEMDDFMRNRPAPDREEEVEAYSKEWIAGRLLGMADTIEALVSATPNTIGD